MSWLAFRLLINAVGLWAAAQLVDGVYLDTRDLGGLLAAALVFGGVNALLKPLVKLLALPLLLLSLGLATLVINAGLFALTAALTDALIVDDFGAALWGALVTSLVSWLLSAFVDERHPTQRR